MQKTSRLHRLLAVVVAVFMAVCCLPLNAFAEGIVTFNIEYLDESSRPVGTQSNVTATPDKDDLVDLTGLTLALPAGYEKAANPDKLFIENGDTVNIRVKAIPPVTVTFQVEYLNEQGRPVGTQKDITVTPDKDGLVDMTAVALAIPAGYEKGAVSDKLFIENGDTVVIPVKTLPTTRDVRANYWDAAANKQAGEGKVTVAVDAGSVDTAALTDLPAGYMVKTPGTLTINDGWIYVEVLPRPATKQVDVNYWDVKANKQAGEGKVTVAFDAVSVDTAVLTDLPAGYMVKTPGTPAINGGWIYVEVEPETPRVAVNIRYLEGDAFVAGGDESFPEGASVRFGTLKLPAGYELDTAKNNADSGFVAKADLKIQVHVKKTAVPAARSIVNLRFVDSETNAFVSGGDYDLAEGVHNYAVLGELGYLPAGYELDKSGDFLVRSGDKLEIPVHKIKTGSRTDTPAAAGGKTAQAKPAPQPTPNPEAHSTAKTNEVVKANVPAANNTKILPQTGVTAEAPVVFGVMMAAALAGAAAYLFAIRKKLN